MKKVLFVYPAMGKFDGNDDFIRSWQMQPLVFGILKSLTPANWECYLQDDRLEAINYAVDVDLVAITVEAYSAKRSYQIAAEFRKRGIPVVMGGYQATLCPQEVEEQADAICIGRAEKLWPQILMDIENDQLQKRYFDDSKEPIPWVKPDRSIFANKNYVNLKMIETSRGCCNLCSFCSIASYYKGSFERCSTDFVVEQLKELKASLFFFVDDNFAGDRSGTLALLKAIKPLKKRWVTQISLHVYKDTELLDAMRDSGCLGALIGFESTSEDVLENMNKKVNQNQNFQEVVAAFTSRGIGVYGTFMLGYDGETVASQKQSLEFAFNAGLFLIALNHIVPFPGTELYRQLDSQNRLLSPQWWLDPNYKFGMIAFQPQLGTAQSLQDFCIETREKLYSSRSILRRSLKISFWKKPFVNHIVFLYLNFMIRSELKRFGWPLGLENKKEQVKSDFRLELADNSKYNDREICELLDQTPMQAEFAESITTYPSFWGSLDLLGFKHKVWIGRNKSNLNKLIYLTVLSTRKEKVSGASQEIGYLSQLRTAPEARQGWTTAKFYKKIKEENYLSAPNICLTAILDQNEKAVKFLTSKRNSFIPKYTALKALRTLLFSAKQHYKLKQYNNIKITTATKNDLEPLLLFWQKQANKYVVAPDYRLEDFEENGTLGCLKPQDIYIAKKGNQIIACAGLMDVSSKKQYKITKYPKQLKYLRPFLNLYFSLKKQSKIPKLNQNISTKFISFTAAKDQFGFEMVIKEILKSNQNTNDLISFTKSCQSELWKIMDKLNGLEQKSTLYQVDLNGNSKKCPHGEIYIEGSML